jgi:hypothetical protein
VDLKINGESWIAVKLHILDNLPCNIELGLGPWSILPLTLTLNGKIIFKVFSQVATVKTKPKFKKWEGVPFVNGTDEERNLGLNIVLKHSTASLNVQDAMAFLPTMKLKYLQMVRLQECHCSPSTR